MNKRFLVIGVGAAAFALMTGCGFRQGRPHAVADAVKLPIPDRSWDPQRPDPDVGWCGEACIQMAMAYYGKETSQARINQAGRPQHPDLYEGDMDQAMRGMGVAFVRYESSGDVPPFVAWIQNQLRRGHPVICGCKIYPDEHPDWSVDHFVLAVGFNAEGLWLNTQLDLNGQVLVPYAQLYFYQAGYSFKNRQNRYFGRAVTGLVR